MAQNCKVKLMYFAVTQNAISKELVLRLPHKIEVNIIQEHLDYYLNNYECFKQENMNIGKVWFFKSKINQL